MRSWRVMPDELADLIDVPPLDEYLESMDGYIQAEADDAYQAARQRYRDSDEDELEELAMNASQKSSDQLGRRFTLGYLRALETAGDYLLQPLLLVLHPVGINMPSPEPVHWFLWPTGARRVSANLWNAPMSVLYAHFGNEDTEGLALPDVPGRYAMIVRLNWFDWAGDSENQERRREARRLFTGAVD
jgi:hypothetical protein